MTKSKQGNDTNKNKDRIKKMISSVRKDLASQPKEWSYEELVELDPRLSEDADF